MTSPSDAVLQVHTLGGFRVVARGETLPESAWRRRKARQLFKCLLTRPSHRLTRDEAIELLWPTTDDPDAASSNLRSTIFAIRRALDLPELSTRGGLVLVDRDIVCLRPEVQIWIDAEAFERLIAQAQGSDDPLPLLEQANALYAGEYLPDDLYEDWAGGRREHLKRLWVELQVALARQGDPEQSGAALLRLLEADPCDERAARALMRLYVRQGRRTEALRVYQRLSQALRGELSVEPSERTAALYEQIQAGPPRPQTSPPPLTREREPRPHPDPLPEGEGAGGDRVPGEEGVHVREAQEGQRPAPPLAAFAPSHVFPAPVRLIDRQVELAQLERALERGREGGQAILVGAPAGTGKSTLVGALAQRAERAGVLCLAGGCYEQEGVVPLGPFQEAIGDYLLAQPAERVRADLGAAALDLAALVPELRYHLSLAEVTDAGPQADRARLFGAVHACLRSLAERGPVLLCLEDLHAADAATFQLIHYLARQSRRLPLTMVATFRSEEVRSGQPLAQLMASLLRDRLAEQVELGAFDRDDTARLVAALLEGPASEALQNSLYAATEGNPLFVEQLILALREEGRVDRQAGIWQQTSDDLARGIPRIVREVIGQRVDRLSPRCQATLALAAVLGRAVEHRPLLVALEPLDEADVLADLDEALAAHLIHETPTGYAFGHALVREAVYWSLSSPRRMLLHARAGETLERLAGGRAADQSAELAHHFALAGESPRVRARALRYSLEAGRRAAALASHREALTHYSRACGLIEREDESVEPGRRLQALEGRAGAERELAMYHASIGSFRKVLELADDPIQRARAHGAISYAQRYTGQTPSALAEIETGLGALDAAPEGPNTAIARIRLQSEKASLFFLEGRYREMLPLGEQMLRSAGELRHARSLVLTHNALGSAYMGLGQVERALEQYDLALQASERTQDRVYLAFAHENLGVQHYRAGRFPSARTHLERAVTLFHDSAGDHRAVRTFQTLGRVWLAEGDPERAREQAELALALAVESGDRREAECHDLLGAIYAAQADWEAAEQAFEQALAIRDRAGHAAGRVESLVGLGLVRQRRGDWARARELDEEAVTTAATMDPSPQELVARRQLGRLLWLIGEETAATEQVERALALAEEMPRSIEYCPTLIVAAEFRWRAGRLDEAIAYAEQALETGMTAELTVGARLYVATLLAWAGRVDRAEPHAREAVRLAERIKTPGSLGQAYLAAARVATAKGDLAAAAAAFETALKWRSTARLPYERAITLRDYGQALAAAGQVERGRELMREALDVFEQLGARPTAARCRALLEAWTVDRRP